MKLKILLLVLAACLPSSLSAQNFVYTRSSDMKFFKPFNENFVCYLSSSKKESINTILVNVQLSMKVLLLTEYHKLSVGIGFDGINGFDDLSLGVWGVVPIWSQDSISLKLLIKRLTLVGFSDLTARVLLPVSWNQISLKPDLLIISKKDLVDYGLTAGVSPSKKTELEVTYLLKQKQGQLSIRISR